MNPMTETSRFELLNGSLPPAVLDAMLKGLILLSLVALLALLLRKSSAAARHGVWLAGLVGVLALPLLTSHLPDWKILPRTWLPETGRPSAAVQPASNNGATPLTVVGKPLSMSTAGGIAMASPAPLSTELAPAGTGLSENAGTEAGSSASTGSLSFSQWLAMIWLAGLLILFARLLIGRAGLALLTHSAGKVSGGELQSEVQDLCRQLGIQRKVVLLLSKKRVIPMTWGVFRPRVLLPTEAARWTPEKRRTILLHELIHVARRDSLSLMVGQIALAIHWFNPLVWVAVWRLSVEREQACDDRVIGNGINPSDYAELILKMSAAFPTSRLSGATATAMAKPIGLEKRLRGILNPKRNRRSPGSGPVLAGGTLLALIICPLAMIDAADETTRNPKSESAPDPVATPTVQSSPRPVAKQPTVSTASTASTAPGGFSDLKQVGKLFRVTSNDPNPPTTDEPEARARTEQSQTGWIRVIPSDPDSPGPDRQSYRILLANPDGQLLSFAVDDEGGAVLVSDGDGTKQQSLLVKDERRSDNRNLMIRRLDQLRAQIAPPAPGHEHTIELRLDLHGVEEFDGNIALGGLLLEDDTDQAGLDQLYGEIAQQLAEILNRLDLAMATRDEVHEDSSTLDDKRAKELLALDRLKLEASSPDLEDRPADRRERPNPLISKQPTPGVSGLGALAAPQQQFPADPAPGLEFGAAPDSNLSGFTATAPPAPRAIEHQQTMAAGIGSFGQRQVRRASSAELYKLALPVSGIVSEAPVKVGTRVKKGQLLLQLDDRTGGQRSRHRQTATGCGESHARTSAHRIRAGRKPTANAEKDSRKRHEQPIRTRSESAQIDRR